MGYLSKKGVSFELIEFQSAGRTVQGALFGPDPKLFHEAGIAVVLVHGVESYWYSGPTMFLGCYLAEAGYTALAYNGVHSGESFRTSEFEVAVEEVDAAIGFVQARGFEKIFLGGHSLGTPIVEYYQGDNPHPSAKRWAFTALTSIFQASQRSLCSVPSSMRSLPGSAAAWLGAAKAKRSNSCHSAKAK